jgi:hypothetical protein
MLRVTRHLASGRRCTRLLAPVGILATVLTAVSGLAILGAAGASSQHSSTVALPTPALLTTPIDELGQAAADAALGMRTPYYEPPTVPDPATPGTTIVAGADQPDPFMLIDGGRLYLFTSQNRITANIPVRSGTAVGHWGLMSDALPVLPHWAQAGETWAPDVHRFGNHYVLYFTAALAGVYPGVECIGAAISTKPAGPYLPGAKPFICQRNQGGSIDPRTFVDSDGALYLLWKSDNNSNLRYGATNIYSQPLAADGLRLLGQPTRIFGPDKSWQDHLVEAPDLVLVRGSYYLFYSGNWFNNPGYAIGVATCAGPAGPCADTSTVPLLASNAQGSGPGEESVFTDADGVWLLYTPFRSALPEAGPPRPVAMARLGFGPDGPYLAAPESVNTGG